MKETKSYTVTTNSIQFYKELLYENVSWKIHLLPTNIPHTMYYIIILFMGAFKFQQEW